MTAFSALFQQFGEEVGGAVSGRDGRGRGADVRAAARAARAVYLGQIFAVQK